MKKKMSTPTKKKKAEKEFYFYGEPAAVVLQRLETKLEQGKVSKVAAILQAIWVLEKIVLSSNMKVDGKYVSIEWLYSLTEEMLATKLNTLLNAVPVGGLVHALTIFGSSRIQAIRAVAKWLLLSETKVRDAARMFDRYEMHPDSDCPFKILLEMAEGDINLRRVVLSIQKPFPSDFPKAIQAFIKVKEALMGAPRQIKSA